MSKRAGDFTTDPSKPQQPPSTPIAAVKKALWEKHPNNVLDLSLATGLDMAKVQWALRRLYQVGELRRTHTGEYVPVITRKAGAKK